MKKSKRRPKSYDRKLLDDPKFHAQNVYAIVMRTLAQFEFALGRRVPWGSDGHQLHVAPHAFADANAFYSREDRALFFGYFTGAERQARLHLPLARRRRARDDACDPRRAAPRYLEPSTPDQAAFHEGFADVVALLSLFSLPDVVRRAARPQAARQRKLIAASISTREA